MAYTILAAVDIGPMAEHVLSSAAVLARMLQADVHVRHVSEHAPAGYAPSAGAAEAIERDEESLIVLAGRASGGVEPASVRVLSGAPAAMIVEAARALRADLIILGPHSGGELSAKVFGTTADRIVRGARVPCLVVRAPLPSPLTSIVVPTDFSPAAAAAVRIAGRLVMAAATAAAGGNRLDVHLLHIGWPWDRVDDSEFERLTLRPRLAAAEDTLMEAAAGHAAVHSHVVWAPRIADEIADWTRHSGGSLIVMATAGMSGTRRPLLGSVAARVARHAPCPVLLVPFDAARRGGDNHPAPKLDCVVTGTDFSAASLGAADWVASEFPPGVRQLLVHVVELPDAPAYARGTPEIRDRLMAEMREQGEIRLGHLFADALQADRRVVVGRGPDELATAAVDADADLIVIGGHTHPRGLSSLLGTTAEQLIRCSPVPVLIVRGRPATAPRRILASVDGSPQSHHVLTWAKTLASKLDAALHVVHVLNPKFLGAAKLVSGMRAAHEMERSYEEQADHWLRELVTAAGIDPESCDLSLATGDAVYEVIALQQRSGADLLVVGSRGAGALGRTLIGSVSYAVIRGAMCPVLVVRGGEPDE